MLRYPHITCLVRRVRTSSENRLLALPFLPVCPDALTRFPLVRFSWYSILDTFMKIRLETSNLFKIWRHIWFNSTKEKELYTIAVGTPFGEPVGGLIYRGLWEEEGGSRDGASLSEEGSWWAPGGGGVTPSLCTQEDMLRRASDTGISLHRGPFPAERILKCWGRGSYNVDFW